MLGDHSAILSTFIKLPFSIKTFVLSIFEWPLKTGFTVFDKYRNLCAGPFVLYCIEDTQIHECVFYHSLLE